MSGCSKEKSGDGSKSGLVSRLTKLFAKLDEDTPKRNTATYGKGTHLERRHGRHHSTTSGLNRQDSGHLKSGQNSLPTTLDSGFTPLAQSMFSSPECAFSDANASAFLETEPSDSADHLSKALVLSDQLVIYETQSETGIQPYDSEKTQRLELRSPGRLRPSTHEEFAVTILEPVLIQLDHPSSCQDNLATETCSHASVTGTDIDKLSDQVNSKDMEPCSSAQADDSSGLPETTERCLRANSCLSEAVHVSFESPASLMPTEPSSRDQSQCPESNTDEADTTERKEANQHMRHRSDSGLPQQERDLVRQASGLSQILWESLQVREPVQQLAAETQSRDSSHESEPCLENAASIQAEDLCTAHSLQEAEVAEARSSSDCSDKAEEPSATADSSSEKGAEAEMPCIARPDEAESKTGQATESSSEIGSEQGKYALAAGVNPEQFPSYLAGPEQASPSKAQSSEAQSSSMCTSSLGASFEASSFEVSSPRPAQPEAATHNDRDDGAEELNVSQVPVLQLSGLNRFCDSSSLETATETSPETEDKSDGSMAESLPQASSENSKFSCKEAEITESNADPSTDEAEETADQLGESADRETLSEDVIDSHRLSEDSESPSSSDSASEDVSHKELGLVDACVEISLQGSFSEDARHHSTELELKPEIATAVPGQDSSPLSHGQSPDGKSAKIPTSKQAGLGVQKFGKKISPVQRKSFSRFSPPFLKRRFLAKKVAAEESTVSLVEDDQSKHPERVPSEAADGFLGGEATSAELTGPRTGACPHASETEKRQHQKASHNSVSGTQLQGDIPGQGSSKMAACPGSTEASAEPQLIDASSSARHMPEQNSDPAELIQTALRSGQGKEEPSSEKHAGLDAELNSLLGPIPPRLRIKIPGLPTSSSETEASISQQAHRGADLIAAGRDVPHLAVEVSEKHSPEPAYRIPTLKIPQAPQPRWQDLLSQSRHPRQVRRELLQKEKERAAHIARSRLLSRDSSFGSNDKHLDENHQDIARSQSRAATDQAKLLTVNIPQQEPTAGRPKHKWATLTPDCVLDQPTGFRSNSPSNLPLRKPCVGESKPGFEGMQDVELDQEAFSPALSMPKDHRRVHFANTRKSEDGHQPVQEVLRQIQTSTVDRNIQPDRAARQTISGPFELSANPLWQSYDAEKSPADPELSETLIRLPIAPSQPLQVASRSASLNIHRADHLPERDQAKTSGGPFEYAMRRTPVNSNMAQAPKPQLSPNNFVDIAPELGMEWRNTVGAQVDLAEVFKRQQPSLAHRDPKLCALPRHSLNGFQGDSASRYHSWGLEDPSQSIWRRGPPNAASRADRWSEAAEPGPSRPDLWPPLSQLDQRRTEPYNERLRSLDFRSSRPPVLAGRSTPPLQTQFFAAQPSSDFKPIDKARFEPFQRQNPSADDDIIRPRFSLSIVRAESSIPQAPGPVSSALSTNQRQANAREQHLSAQQNHTRAIAGPKGSDAVSSTQGSLGVRSLPTNLDRQRPAVAHTSGSLSGAESRKLPTLNTKPKEDAGRIPPRPLWTSHTSTKALLQQLLTKQHAKPTAKASRAYVEPGFVAARQAQILARLENSGTPKSSTNSNTTKNLAATKTGPLWTAPPSLRDWDQSTVMTGAESEEQSIVSPTSVHGHPLSFCTSPRSHRSSTWQPDMESVQEAVEEEGTTLVDDETQADAASVISFRPVLPAQMFPPARLTLATLRNRAVLDTVACDVDLPSFQATWPDSSMQRPSESSHFPNHSSSRLPGGPAVFGQLDHRQTLNAF